MAYCPKWTEFKRYKRIDFDTYMEVFEDGSAILVGPYTFNEYVPISPRIAAKLLELKFPDPALTSKKD